MYRCLLDLERCFGSFWTRSESVPSSEMFTRLAFQYPDCGDCRELISPLSSNPSLFAYCDVVIKALVTASGPLGLSAFLPPHGTTFLNAPLEEGKAYPKFLPPPHLPLTPTWHEADFSLGAIMQTTALPEESVDMRVYSMKLLSRYLYLSGEWVHPVGGL
jgi:3-O-alpha-D-mannopyranosyl-alpha-D-mannopyranose xylosylphosphotransferase